MIDCPSCSKMDKHKGGKKRVWQNNMEIVSTFINAKDNFFQK